MAASPLPCVLLLAIFSVIACAAGLPAPRSLSPVEAGTQEKLESSHFPKGWEIYAVAGGGAAFLLIVLLLIILISVCCCYKRRVCCFKRHGYAQLERRPLISSYRSPDALYTSRRTGHSTVEVRPQRGGRQPERTVGEELQRQKVQQDQTDRGAARKIILYHLRNNRSLELVQDLPDMGSRMLKFWYKVRDAEGRDQLLTIAPVSQKCPLVLDDKMMKTMNNLLQQLSHPNLHPVYNITYVAKDHMVIILQPFIKSGSLKDLIYRSTPTSEWTMKYSRRCRGLSPAKVALYGKQILEALLYLESHKFPAIGHVQTGNILVDRNDRCSLGGYENALLGYKTRSYKVCKEHLEHIDLILFGHVVFEMCCGYELTELSPGEQHYADIMKEQKLQQILHFIFHRNQDGTFTHTIKDVYDHEFFQEAHPPIERGARADHTHLSADIKNMLAKVAKNKPRQQRTGGRHRKKKTGKSETEVGGAGHAPATETPPADAAAAKKSS